MVEPTALGRSGFRLLFFAAIALVVFVRLLPVHPGGGGLPAPDGVLLLLLAWVQRRPRDLPVWLVAAVALFADIVFVRPPGLWALLTVAATEVLRRRAHLTGDRPFAVEWGGVAALVAAMTVARLAVLGLTLVPQPPLSAVALDAGVTILAYPLAALVCARVLGVRARDPSGRIA